PGPAGPASQDSVPPAGAGAQPEVVPPPDPAPMQRSASILAAEPVAALTVEITVTAVIRANPGNPVPNPPITSLTNTQIGDRLRFTVRVTNSGTVPLTTVLADYRGITDTCPLFYG